MREQIAKHTLREHYQSANQKNVVVQRENAIALVDIMTMLWRASIAVISNTINRERIRSFWALESILTQSHYRLEFDHMHLRVILV